MTHSFNCIATGIGSLPIAEPDRAAALSLRYLAEAPIWPQLPQKDFREQMDGQYSEALPGLTLDAAKKRFFFDTTEDLTPQLELETTCQQILKHPLKLRCMPFEQIGPRIDWGVRRNHRLEVVTIRFCPFRLAGTRVGEGAAHAERDRGRRLHLGG